MSRRGSLALVTPPSTRRSLARTAAGYAAQAAINAVPYGRTVYGAYRAISGLRNVVRRYRVRKKATVAAAKRGHGKWRGVSTGMSGGRFKRPRRNKITKETQYLKEGYHTTGELFGRVEDPHCVYLHHSTYHRQQFVKTIMGALVRKLFKRAGLPLNSRQAELPLFGQGNSDGFRLEYTTQNQVDASLSTVAYITVNDQNLTNVLNGFTGMRDHLLAYLQQTDAREPYRLTLFSSDRNGLDTNWRMAGHIDIQNEVLEIGVTSSIRVQNRTAAANAAEGNQYDADRIDNQPVKGYLYEFKHADPRLKFVNDAVLANSNVALNRSGEFGFWLVRSAELNETSYQEPPVPKLWANCSKSSYVKLEPGYMKMAKISYTYKGKFTNLMKKLRSETSTGSLISGVVGRSQIIALEEKIRTVTGNPITIQYERELKIGVKLKSGRTAPFVTELSSGEISNVPV